jgi:two-component system cell cycle sensor histidine kinase/response regulator CckA
MSPSPHIPEVTGPSAIAAAAWWDRWFNASEDAQVICNAKGLIQQINPKAQHFLGLRTPDEAIGSSVFTFFTNETRKRVATLVASTRKIQDTVSSATMTVNGRIICMADVIVTSLEGGFALVCIKDTSRRWRTEAHLLRLSAAIDATADVFFLTDSDYRITFVNSSFQTVTGYSIEDALGQTAEFLRAPEQTSIIRESLEAVAQGKDWTGELINLSSSGSQYHVSATMSPIYDRQDRLIGYVCSEHDITVSKGLQNQILLERNLVRSVLDSLDAAVYTLDQDFRITHANQGWRNLPSEHGYLKLQNPPHHGDSFLDLIPDPERREELRVTFQEILKTGESRGFQTNSGRSDHWSIRISPWIHNSRVVGLIYSITDDRKLMELRQQLYHAQKMQTVGTLAAGVAHDFNNLLLAILGNVSLLLESQIAEPRRSQVVQIEQAATRAAEITEQLLSFSRSSVNKAVVFDLNQIVTEASSLAKRSLKSGVKLEIHPNPAALWVRMDRTRASQAVLNLCVNAQDAMPNGGRLTILNRCAVITPMQALKHGKPEGGSYACCSVSDCGTGIAPDVLPRIFDPFFTTKGPLHGTGLGLFIVHNVVAECSGFIEIDSTVGEGTTLHLYLPLASAPAAEPPAVRDHRHPRGKGRVLIVDDLDLLRDLAVGFFSAAGFQTQVANDGEQALRLLDEDTQGFNLLFTDYNMPQMNGLDLIARALTKDSRLKCILTSGYLTEEDRLNAEALGRTRVLTKPYQIEKALTDIIEWLRS